MRYNLSDSSAKLQFSGIAGIKGYASIGKAVTVSLKANANAFNRAGFVCATDVSNGRGDAS
jgi:hypothetical protein